MEASLAGKHLLVVEDDAVISLDLQAHLVESGATAVQASTSAEALDLIQSSRFDAAILDVHLKDGNSYAIADALRSQATPFVFLSGYLTIREGYTDIPFLAKPYAAATVTDAIATLLATKA